MIRELVGRKRQGTNLNMVSQRAILTHVCHGLARGSSAHYLS